jgi:hypothetical protein
MPGLLINKQERRGVFAARIIIGLIYGLLLYWSFAVLDRSEPLYGFAGGEDWSRFVNIARLVAWLGLLPLLFGVGRIPLFRLACWSAGAVSALFVFGLFGPGTVWDSIDSLVNIWLFSLIVLFIVHEFVQSSVDDGRVFADYKTYFENAWGRGFQVVLALGFLGAYWVVISLGAYMFDLIGLDYIRRALFSKEFAWISSGVAFAVAAHLADADIGLTRGARQIGLMLLSWLAVLMTMILTAFLIALFFTGLQPLWDTGAGTVLLLNAAATMILLINAAYQDGSVSTSAFMRGVVRFAAAPLVAVSALAALGLWLRVEQYGLTPARVLAGAELLIVSIYAAGYAVAAIKPGQWMALLRPVNIGAAIVVAALLSALMTPVLAPARVSVADQISRLNRGAVEPDEFDFGFLASARAGHWGASALERLTARTGTPRDERIALLAQNPGSPSFNFSEQSIASRREALRFLGDGGIPDGLVLRREGEDPIERCLEGKRNFDERVKETDRILSQPERLRPAKYDIIKNEDKPLQDGRCLMRLIDVDFDGDEDALVMRADSFGYSGVSVFLQEDAPVWRYVGQTKARLEMTDRAASDAFWRSSDEDRRAAAIEGLRSARAVAAPKKDLVSLGQRFRLALPEDFLTMEEMRSRIVMEEGVEPPAGVLKTFPEPPVSWGCAPLGVFRKWGSSCYGRYLELAGGGSEEFLVIEIMEDNVTMRSYENGAQDWVSFGDSKKGFEKHYQTIAESLGKGDEPLSPEVKAAFDREFLDDLKVVDAAVGDIVFSDFQFVVESGYESRRRYR